MPLLNVTDAGEKIPYLAGREILAMFNEGPDDVRIGWEPVVTANGTPATDGMLWKAGTPFGGGGHHINMSGPIQLICAAGETATVSYTQLS